jgi:hypothetical protein
VRVRRDDEECDRRGEEPGGKADAAGALGRLQPLAEPAPRIVEAPAGVGRERHGSQSVSERGDATHGVVIGTSARELRTVVHPGAQLDE